MRVTHRLLVACLLGLVLPSLASAQPFGAWLLFDPATSGRVAIPHSTALNPTGGFTFEAWVNLSAAGGCRSIAGKHWQQAWWVGICGTTLRSYLRGTSSLVDGGTIPGDAWTHIAVTFDGSHRRHYINGEQVREVAETDPLTTSTSEMRIGSDVAYEFTPDGSIDEVRLWNVARSQAELRAAINQRITAALPGLVGVWPLDGNGNDVVGPHDGAVSNAFAQTFPVAFDCLPGTATVACLNERFSTRVQWRTSPAGGPPDGDGTLVLTSDDSGLFWFFSADNWELMVKALNGCGLNDRYWVFSAATTNVFYRLEVLDVRAGVQKIYFNYQGPPAPAVTDTSAFATCP